MRYKTHFFSKLTSLLPRNWRHTIDTKASLAISFIMFCSLYRDEIFNSALFLMHETAKSKKAGIKDLSRICLILFAVPFVTGAPLIS